MKVLHQLDRLEPMVLEPLRGLPDDDWHRAPAGQWSAAQILNHLALAVDSVADAFEKRSDGGEMKRRATPRETMLRHLLLGIGKFPVKVESPAAGLPGERPDPELCKAQFRMGVERIKTLVERWPQDRQLNVFVKHPVVGDLNLPEWVRFHFVHCRHHRDQILAVREWAAGSPPERSSH